MVNTYNNFMHHVICQIKFYEMVGVNYFCYLSAMNVDYRASTRGAKDLTVPCLLV